MWDVNSSRTFPAHGVAGANETVIPRADVTISQSSSAYYESLVAGVPTILFNELNHVREGIPEEILALDGVLILDGLDDLSPLVAQRHAGVKVEIAELRAAGIIGEPDIVDRVWARVDAVQ
jgi:hypothetical protein